MPKKRKETEENKEIIQFEVSIPEIPDFVSIDPAAKEEWDRVVPELYKNGVISKLDRTILAGYCLNYSRVIKVERFLQKNNMTVKVGRKGYTQVRPEVTIMRESWKLMRTFAEMLGLSPNSRIKMKMDEPGDDDHFFD